MILLLGLAVVGGRVAPAGAEAHSGLTPQQQKRLTEGDRLAAEGRKHLQAGRLPEALAAFERVLGIEREVRGDVHDGVAGALAQVAAVQELREDFAAARKAREESLAIRTKLYGERDWRVTDARLALQDAARLPTLSAEQRKQLAEVRELVRRFEPLRNARQFQEAIKVLERVRDVRVQVLGPKHPEVADSLNKLGVLYHDKKDYARAEALYRQAMAIYLETVGDRHPSFALCCQNLALVYTAQKNYGRAEPLMLQALEVRKQALGAKHPRFLQTLDKLALLYENQNDWARAEPLRRQAAETLGRTVGEKHADTVRALNRLTDLYQAWAEAALAREDFAVAGKARQGALEAQIKVNGPDHWKVRDARVALEEAELLPTLTAEQRARLAEATELAQQIPRLRAQGRLQEAQAAAERARGLQQQVLGEKHAVYGATLSWLAAIRQDQKDYGGAVPLYLRALEVFEKTLGDKHPNTVQTLTNLGDVYQAQGAEELAQEEFARARTLLQQALAMRIKAEGPDHWRVTDARLALAHLERLVQITGEQRRSLREANRLNQRAVLLDRQGNYAEALPLAKRAFDLHRELLGEGDPYTPVALSNLGWILRQAGQRDKAEPLLRQALELRKKVLGEGHPAYADNLNMLAVLYHDQGAYARAEPLYRQALESYRQALGEKHAAYATVLNNLANLYSSRRAYGKAEPLYRQALEVRKEVLGEKHPSFVANLNDLANLYVNQRANAKAEPLYQRVVAIRKETVGEKHPDYASSVNALAVFYHDQMSAYSRAEPLYQKALKIYQEAVGEKHPDYLNVLNNLALLYSNQGAYARAEQTYRRVLDLRRQVPGGDRLEVARTLDSLAQLAYDQGDYAGADPLRRQALEIYREASGDRRLDVAASLHCEANLYRDQGDYARAEFLYRQALEVWKQVHGETHPDIANSLDHLATLYQMQGDYARAEPLHRQTLEYRRKSLGEDHLETSWSMLNLANVYREQGKYALAEPLYRRALDARKKALGEHHPETARPLNELANLYRDRGDFAAAEPLYREALDIRTKALGEHHPDTAQTLDDLARMYLCQGKYGDAAKFSGEAARISLANLDSAAGALAERQQLAMTRAFRYQLHHALSCMIQARLPAEEAYEYVLAWKGAVFLRQRHQRALRQLLASETDPELRRLFADLESTSLRLAKTAANVPTTRQQAGWKKRLAALTEEKERLEAELARRSAVFRRRREQGPPSARQIQEILPPGAALVDVLEYVHSRPSATSRGKVDRERRVVAFVVRPGQPVLLVELGLAERINAAVQRWRTAVRLSSPVERQDDPRAELGRLLCGKLLPHLQGVQTLLYSPDGALATVPLGALPGRKPGAYLIEETACAVVPAAQVLPEWLRATNTGQAKDKRPSLLLVGDVDFSANPGVTGQGQVAFASTRGGAPGGRHAWSALPGTREEVRSVGAIFARSHAGGEVTVLQNARATEAAVREQAGRHRWLHLATHGFFAPATVRSALAPQQREQDDQSGIGLLDRQGVIGFHPGLLSGVVLAGANRPVGETDDGILTALEVAELDLSRVELAVLSACETGRGREAGGEGVLGLQRAFQVAGARAVVASLWQVADEPTRVLMERFYADLWGKGMGKLEALREAQLWMLREGRRHPRAARGLTREDDAAAEEAGPGRLPPYYWAGFVLGGDWR